MSSSPTPTVTRITWRNTSCAATSPRNFRFWWRRCHLTLIVKLAEMSGGSYHEHARFYGRSVVRHDRKDLPWRGRVVQIRVGRWAFHLSRRRLEGFDRNREPRCCHHVQCEGRVGLWLWFWILRLCRYRRLLRLAHYNRSVWPQH